MDNSTLPGCVQGDKARVPGDRIYHTLLKLPDGTPVVCGGAARSGHTYDDCQKFDLETDTWQPYGGKLVYRRQRPEHSFHPEVGMIIMGGRGHGKKVEISDDYGLSWRALPDRPHNRNEDCVLIVDKTTVFTAGGWEVSFHGQKSKTAHLLNLETNVWTEVASLTHGRSQHSCGLVPSKREVVAVGGYNIQPSTLEVEIFNLDSQQWRIGKNDIFIYGVPCGAIRPTSRHIVVVLRTKLKAHMRERAMVSRSKNRGTDGNFGKITI